MVEKSEHYIQTALKTLTKNRTTLVIAHRLSTIEHADKIIVLDEGEIVAMGHHTELIKNNPPYILLQQAQQREPVIAS